MSNSEFIKNAAGRLVPQVINGKPVTPFKGVGSFIKPLTSFLLW